MASEKPIGLEPVAQPAGDVKEPTTAAEPTAVDPELDAALPTGWKYRARKIGPISIPWYASPRTQLVMVSFVCFLCPGMFNALGGLGGGGKTDATLADNMVRAPPQPSYLPASALY